MIGVKTALQLIDKDSVYLYVEYMASKKAEYSKRPLWQWTIIYLVIGAVIYGLIYFFVLSQGTTPFGY